MRILIVEDVTLVAERISDLAKMYLKECFVKISHTLEDAKLCITEDTYDLLFLDLNLNGKDGFDLLKTTTASSFYTIIITANRDQASNAFDFGVFDFISKPISEKRFKIAIDRFLNNNIGYREKVKYLTIKSRGIVDLIAIEDIDFIKASGNYSQIYTIKNKSFLHDKNLEKLLKILPDNFIRIHRSYIVCKDKIRRIIKHGGGKYSIELISKETLPLSRGVYKQLLL
ncbi:LytTR family DNA-binding domain-containing protein [Aquimarina sp. 2201CG5-10]|uniref:LytR/AlgR family response regulator transcription factor n=1 Tax=Aquimarina callyspongiae TaxID=3098150 RepID=UPI002AB3F9C3|nr:LytTR family DNA-binding domain-containing protein [Aquimarina sp. 2201CG5-10]MDY8134873.1 LytTR family DNA-binding domain-containing protein [Aquimarina sp. 2201CG5-10]